MIDSQSGSWVKAALRDVRRDWRDIGGLGRVALVGLLASSIIAVVLGFSITASARGHLLDARTDLLSGLSIELVDTAGLPSQPGSADYVQFDEGVRLRLLGGETVRVKLWDQDGTILYSDSPDFEGSHFDLPPSAVAAFDGEATSRISDLSEPAHEFERDLGELIEFFIPVGVAASGPTAVFEIEQRTDSLDAALGHIERNVWLSIGSGIVALAVFLALLFAARTRDLNRRRSEAERLLTALFRAQEEERHHIVGALHDDIGQPLYRLLYGLEGSRAKLGVDDPVGAELAGLQALVRDIDSSLRSELRVLHHGLAEDAGLETALLDLAGRTMGETDLDIRVRVDAAADLTRDSRSALFRAAQEAVVNVRKHAEASRIDIAVTTQNGRVILVAQDDGRGWTGKSGLGLTTVRERLEAVGGGLAVESHGGEGTVFTAWIPSDERQPA